MLEQVIRRIVNTGKTYKWLKYPCLLVLALVFGCVALAEYAVKAYRRGKEAVARLWAAVNQRREATPTAKPFVSGHRPAKRVMAVALTACMVLTLLPVTALAVAWPSNVGETVTIEEADYLYGGDCSETGLDLSSTAPVAATAYKAGDGYLLWKPTADAGNTLSLHDADILSMFMFWTRWLTGSWGMLPQN